MSVGSAIRGALGPRLARTVGRWYRAAFVDLEVVADCVAAAIPSHAHVLDVGGGDGAPLNYLLDLRPDITVTTIDVAPEVGQWIDARHEGRVIRRPGTSLELHLESLARTPDVLTIVDVIHHIPLEVRPEFWAAVGRLLERAPRLTIIVKDVEPGHVRATLGYWADRYITGDPAVNPISRAELRADIHTALPGLACTETALFRRDPPNYAAVFARADG